MDTGSLQIFSSGEFILVVILGAIFLFVLAIYLLLRRTVTSFREGMNEGR
jgi:hypothetical protein